MSRMLKRLIMGAVLVAAPSLSRLGYAQGPATTTVQDTVYKSDGSLASGTVVITWPAFVSGDGKPVVGGTKTVPLSGGNLAVTLTPNAGGTPSGTSYRVRYYESAGRFFEETWVVPISNPLSSPGQPTVTNVGTPGTTTYYYWVSATNAEGETQLGPSQVTTTSNATLDTNNYNQVDWDAVTGATGYKVYRTPTATVPSGTGSYLVGETATTTINDQSNSLQQATIPVLNSTDPRKLSDVRVTAAPSPSVTLAASQISGTAIVSNPDKTQTISAPAKSGVIPLQLKGHSQAAANVLEVYDSQPSPVLQSRFDSSGAFLTSKTPTFSTMTTGSVLFAGTGGLLSQDNVNMVWNNTDKRLFVGPRAGFDSYAQSFVDASKWHFGLLKSATDAFTDGFGVSVQDSSLDPQLAFTALAEDTHTDGTKAGLFGIYGEARSTLPATKTLADMAAITAQIGLVGDGTVVNALGFQVLPTIKTAGVIANLWGLYIPSLTEGENNWAIQTGAGKVQFGDDVIADKNLYAKAISKVRFADQFAGTDAGEKIAAAYADLPATGGTVDARGLEGGTISQDIWSGSSKPLTLLLGCGTYTITAAQVVTVYSQAVGLGDCTLLHYTPTTGIAFTFDYPSGSQGDPLLWNRGAGLYNLKLQGPGGSETATALFLGGTNGAAYSHFSNIKIEDFGTCLEYSNNTWGTVFDNFHFRDCETALNLPAGLTNTGENLSFSSGFFGGASTYGNDIVLAQSSSDATFVNVSFDNVQVAISNGDQKFVNSHFETVNAGPTDPILTISAGRALLTNPSFLHLPSVGAVPTRLIELTGGAIVLFGMIANSNNTITDLINTSNASVYEFGTAYFSGFTNFYSQTVSNIVINNSFTGHVSRNESISIQRATSATATFDVSAANLFSIARGATNALTIDGSGDVGIGLGTTAATTKLDVNGNFRTTMTTVTFSATPTFDASLGNSFKIALTGNVTSSTLSNAQAGQEVVFLICQDATGNRTFAWPSNVKGGMTIGATLSTCSAQEFLYDGTNAYALSSGVTGM